MKSSKHGVSKCAILTCPGCQNPSGTPPLGSKTPVMAVTSVFLCKHGDFWSWGVSKSTLIISVTGLPHAGVPILVQARCFSTACFSGRKFARGGGSFYDFGTFLTPFWHPSDMCFLPFWWREMMRRHWTLFMPCQKFPPPSHHTRNPTLSVHQKYPPPPERNSMSLILVYSAQQQYLVLD